MGAMSVITMANRPLSHYYSPRDSIHLPTRRHCQSNSRSLRIASSMMIATQPIMTTTLWKILPVVPVVQQLCHQWTTVMPARWHYEYQCYTAAVEDRTATRDDGFDGCCCCFRAPLPLVTASRSSRHRRRVEARLWWSRAGPAGLAASIMLAKLGWERVVVSPSLPLLNIYCW